MGLSKIISGPTQDSGHTPNMIFLLGQWEHALMGECFHFPLLSWSWSDHTLLSFRFSYVAPLCREARPICAVCPWQLMSLSRIQRKLGLSQGPCCMVLPNSWWCPGTRVKRHLQHHCRKMQWGSWSHDSNLTWLRSAAIKAYLVAVRVAKRYYFSIFIASAECCPAILFCIT